MRCGTDNLIVERAEAARTITFESINSLPPDLQPTDLVTIQGFQSIAKTSYQLRKILLQILRSGAHIWDETESRQLSEEECSLLLSLGRQDVRCGRGRHVLLHDHGGRGQGDFDGVHAGSYLCQRVQRLAL